MRAGARKQAHVPVGAAVLEPVGTAPGFLVGTSPLVGGAARAAARAADDVGATRSTSSRCAGLLARARGRWSSGSCASSRCPSRRSRRRCASSTPTRCRSRSRRACGAGSSRWRRSSRRGGGGVRGVRGGAARAPRGRAVLRRRRDDRRGGRAAARRADDRDRRVLHGRADGGAADRPRRLVGVRARRARRVLERGQDGVGGRARGVDRGPRRGLAGGGARRWPRARASRLGADIGIGITGIAGPGGGTPEKPVGTVCLSVVAAATREERTVAAARAGRADVRDRTTTRRAAHAPRAAAAAAARRADAAARRRRAPCARRAPTPASARCACSSRSTSRTRRATRSPPPAPPPTPTSGGRSPPRRSTSRSRSSARARRPTSTAIEPIVAAETAARRPARARRVLLLPPRRARVLTVALADPTARSAPSRRASPPALRGRRRLHAREAAVPRARHRRPAAPARPAAARRRRSTLEPLAFAGEAVTLYASRLHPRAPATRRSRARAWLTATFSALMLSEGHPRGAARPCGARGPPERRRAPRCNWRSCVDFDGIRCATLDVPLDRADDDPGTVPLRIARVGRTSGPTLMYLSGGPGGAGVSEMLSVLRRSRTWSERFRLIGYDQRGTGRSGLLRCPRLEKDPHLRDTGAAEECANRIGSARRHYTTPDSVQDMEAIRQSWASRSSRCSASPTAPSSRSPTRAPIRQHVERLILDSVVDYDDPDPFVTVVFRAMGPSLRSLCPGRCRGISTDPGADLGKLVAQLRAKPLRGLRLRRARPLAPRQDHADGAVRPDAADATTCRRCARRSRPASRRPRRVTARCSPA